MRALTIFIFRRDFVFLLLTAFATNFSKRGFSLRRIWKRNFESDLSLSFSFIRDISSFSRSPRIHVRPDGRVKKGLRVEFEFAEQVRGEGEERARDGKRGQISRITQCDVPTAWHERESREAATAAATPAATLPAEFYEGIYMSAIFYGTLNARSRSVPHCRSGRL